MSELLYFVCCNDPDKGNIPGI
jgi:ribonuclease HI